MDFTENLKKISFRISLENNPDFFFEAVSTETYYFRLFYKSVRLWNSVT